MKRVVVIILALCHGMTSLAGIIEKTLYFNNYSINEKGIFQVVTFPNTRSTGIPGEPSLPWMAVSILLPPGEAAQSADIIYEDLTTLPGKILLMPTQPVRPLSTDSPPEFYQRKEVYLQSDIYPKQTHGEVSTQYITGYAVGLFTFTPTRYLPASQTLSFYRKVTVRIHTTPDERSLAALRFLAVSATEVERVKTLAVNPEMADSYPHQESALTSYDYLIISPATFKNEFQPMIAMYQEKGLALRVVTIDSIRSVMTGVDDQEKIRNFIISERQNHNISYVLLAGNPSLIPCRGFYCYVMSGTTPYTDSNIPADIYYSGLDGNYNANANALYGELDDLPDLYPDISVGRFPVNDTAELHRMIQKTISYQSNPVLGEFSKPLLLGEYLYNNPVTFGSSYMNLLIDDHSDNGYFTHGIPSAANQIGKLYDSLIAPPLTIWQWNSATLLARLNQGNSFIHHLGHANTTYMLRLSMASITNANFSQVNGINHNFQLLYTQGCYDGAFDASGGCIAAKAVTINNFLVAGIFNSRYGWFNQGTTDGPSQHLEREFVSAMYRDTLPETHLGTAHLISKVKTAPWLFQPNEFEPGAQRWCHYCCNVLGDPALSMWTAEPTSFTPVTWTGTISSDWTNPGNWSTGKVPTSLCDVTIAGALHNPLVSTSGNLVCHNLNIAPGGNLTISTGKSITVYGTVTLSAE